MKDCWVTSNKLRNGSAGWPLRPGKVAVLTAHQWPLPRALCIVIKGGDYVKDFIIELRENDRKYQYSPYDLYHQSENYEDTIEDLLDVWKSILA